MTLIVSLSSSVVAGAAIGANVWLSKATLREQRLREDAQRLWHKRSELYVDVLSLMHTVWDDPSYPHSKEFYDLYQQDWDRLFPQMLAFGSSEATRAAREFFSSANYVEHGQAFQRIIGKELQGASPLPPLPWSTSATDVDVSDSAPTRNFLVRWRRARQWRRLVRRR